VIVFKQLGGYRDYATIIGSSGGSRRARVELARFFDGTFGTSFNVLYTGTLLMGHHRWTITVYENGKFLLNLPLNNDTDIIEIELKKFSRKPVGCHKNSWSVSNYILEKTTRKDTTMLCLLVYGMNLTMLRMLIMVVTGYGVTEYKTKLDEWVTT